MMSASLLTHNILYLIGGILNVCVAVFVVASSRKNLNSTVVTFALMSLSVATFQISHLIGTNMPDALSSRDVLMFNLTDIFIGIFMIHWYLDLIGKTKKKSFTLGVVYTSGLAMILYFLANSSAFLQPSVPKMYFPFYYEPGPLYIIMPIWFAIVIIYALFELYAAYRVEIDPIQKNRLRYALASTSYGLVVGSTAFLLVFDIPFDPMWSSFFGLYTLPLAYAIIRYELLDIRILARRAFFYLITMLFLALGIGVVNYIGDFLREVQPDFPRWIMPTLLAILIGESGIYVWQRAKVEEVAKYEFINLVTHKFRSPLTQIKWAADLIASESKSMVMSDESQKALDAIQEANSKMVELTNALVTLNDTDTKKYSYNFNSFPLVDIVNSVALEYEQRFLQKKVDLGVYAVGIDTTVYADPEKMKFVTDILINNALIYTPAGGKVTVRFWQRGKNLEMSIKDTGIGIPPDATPFIFTKFYRAENARKATVEGTGIGLYLANEIVKRNGGTLTYFSQGTGQGTTFVVTLPVKI